MADIELVIKIPKEVKNRLCFGVTYTEDIQVMCEALNNGTPLPKGHGRLIDADALIEFFKHKEYGFIDYSDIVIDDITEDAPTIIEADTESENK